MRDLSSFLNRQSCSTTQTPIADDGREMWQTSEPDTLEIRIAERACQLSQLRGDCRSQSLATWLEAAKEILSKSEGAKTQ